MRNKIFWFTILVLVFVTNCSLLKYEVKKYSYANRSLILYSNNSFKIFIYPDIVRTLGKTERSLISRGEFQKSGDKLILKYKNWNYTDTLYSVIWDETLIMMDKLDIIFVANLLNNRYEFTPHNRGWIDKDEEYKPIYGLPSFPSLFDHYLIRDPISANVININRDSVEITIDKGSNNGIYWGCELTDGKGSYAVQKIFADSSVLSPWELFWQIEYYKMMGEEDFTKDSLISLTPEYRNFIVPDHLYIMGYKPTN